MLAKIIKMLNSVLSLIGRKAKYIYSLFFFKLVLIKLLIWALNLNVIIKFRDYIIEKI